MEDNNTKLVCEECGGDQIQNLVWADANTDEVLDSSTGETQDRWCDDCSGHVDFVLETEFKKRAKEG